MKTMEEEEEDGETYRGGLGAVEEAAVVGECAAGEVAREAAGEPHLRPLPLFLFLLDWRRETGRQARLQYGREGQKRNLQIVDR